MISGGDPGIFDKIAKAHKIPIILVSTHAPRKDAPESVKKE